MHPPRFLATGILLCLCLPAQGDYPAPQPSSTLLVRLKARATTLVQAQALGAELRLRTTRDRLQASKILRGHYLARQKSFDTLRDRTLGNFQKLVKKAQRHLLGRKGLAKVELLRKQCLAVSRQSRLSKAQIKGEIDPRMTQLRELLLPTFANVLAIDKRSTDRNIDAQLTTLRSQHSSLREWYALYASMSTELELHTGAIKHFKKYPVPPGPGDDRRTNEAMHFAIFAGLPMSNTDHSALAFNEDARVRTPPQEYLGTLELNRIRYLLGLALVRIDERLSDAARDHSTDMHKLKFFSHTSPVAGKQRFSQRAANFGTSANAENIAAGLQTGKGAIQAWWYSPGHHRNMLANHRRTGLGQHEGMWTQLFGG